MYVLTAEQMRAADRAAVEQLGLSVPDLMERAGEGVARAIRAHFDAPPGDRVLVVCGKGNNGGDGMVAARHLQASGSHVTVLLAGRGRDLSGAAQLNWTRLKSARVPRLELPEAEAMFERARALALQSDLLVDALLGTGARGPLEGPILAACRAVGSASHVPCVSADLPTGIHATTGAAQPEAVHAALTVTFAFPKFGHLLFPGRAHCGRLEVVDIGIPESVLPADHRRFETLSAVSAASLLPHRAPTAHKGDVGRIRIVGGSAGMLGAPALAARAAMRAGAGTATVCVPRGLYGALAPLLLEATAALYDETDVHTHTFRAVEAQLKDLDGAAALALGPGLSRHHEAAQLAQHLVRRARVPTVLDADGLNAFEGLGDLLAQHAGPLVLTPHAGEFARLTGLPREQVERERLELGARFAAQWHAVVLLKGAPTVVASPEGRSRLNPTGNAGMATGGSGDVLTGMVAAFLGRGMAPWDAASLAAYVHGLAGDLARESVGEESLIASDLIGHLPEALKTLEEAAEEARRHEAAVASAAPPVAHEGQSGTPSGARGGRAAGRTRAARKAS